MSLIKSISSQIRTFVQIDYRDGRDSGGRGESSSCPSFTPLFHKEIPPSGTGGIGVFY
jgi:hypothetical protein